MATRARVGDADYARLLALRVELRRFHQWSAKQARQMGLTPQQHQVLLAVRGHPEETGPTISDISGYLLIRHNTAVELVDRTADLGLVERVGDGADQRVVRLRLTVEGRRRLAALAETHIEELARLTPLVEHLAGDGPTAAADQQQS
jgi:DNA-binding MarR family transcriptional regulator